MRSFIIAFTLLFSLLAMPIWGQDSQNTQDDQDSMDAQGGSIRHTHVYLNIRTGPDTAFDKIGLARPCTPLEVIEASGEWYKIKHGSGEGFVAGWFTHAGGPHCGETPAQPAQQPTQPGAAAPQATPPPAPANEPAQDNKCFGAWTWCSVGAPDTNKFWWNLGWCIAGIENGTSSQSPGNCMGLLGTPLPANFKIPGYNPAGATTTTSTSSSGGSDDSGGGGGGDPGLGSNGCPPNQCPILPRYGGGCGDCD